MADRFVVQVERPHRKCHAPSPRAENCNSTNRFCRDQRLPGSFLGQASKTALVAAAASLAWTGDAWANCVLTPGTPTTLVCDDAGNNYPGGIEYLNFSTGLTAIVGAGVVIDRTPGDGNMGVNLSGNGNHTLALELAPGTIIRTNGFIAQGVQVHSTNNDNVVIVSGANVTTQGLDVAGPTDEITVGILGRASSSTGTGSVVVTQLAGSSIHVSGFKFVVGLHAQSLGLGDVFVESAGTVTAVGTDPDATYVSAISAAIGNPDSTGRMDVILHAGGAASTDAQLSPALIAENSGYGATNVIVDGTVEALGDLSDGVFAYSSNPNSTALTSVFLGGNGSITTHQLGYGIWSLAGGLGSSLVSVAGSIRTFGDEAFGVGLDVPSATNAASHQVVISGQGNIETSGSGSHGVRALLAGPGSLTLDLRDSARVTTSGDQAAGVYGKTLGDVLLVTASGTAVTASGSEAFGAQLDGGSDVLVLHAGSIAALGRFGVGLFAFSDASATVTLGAGASVMGGWQDTAKGVGPNSASPAAGVILGAAAASSLVNAGSIGAGSDRAVIDATRGGGTPAGNMTIANSGTITGFVELAAGGTNRFDNLAGGLFDIRHFADTDGDGVRDTKRVAISDFGDPLTSVFSNSGLTRLAPVSGAAATDPTGYYVPTTGFDSRPLEASYYNLNRNGVVQGQLVNLGEFDHSGILDLRGPAIGNSLVITSNATAGGAPGSSVFVANGGQILLNAVLNDGIQPGGATNNYADMLIVDSTRLGSAPARIHVGIDPTLSGTLTTGNGIELVEVRDKTASAPGVFTLGSRVAAGAYEYLLYHNGVGADAADGNWYLRSTLIVSARRATRPKFRTTAPRFPSTWSCRRWQTASAWRCSAPTMTAGASRPRIPVCLHPPGPPRATTRRGASRALKPRQTAQPAPAAPTAGVAFSASAAPPAMAATTSPPAPPASTAMARVTTPVRRDCRRGSTCSTGSMQTARATTRASISAPGSCRATFAGSTAARPARPTSAAIRWAPTGPGRAHSAGTLMPSFRAPGMPTSRRSRSLAKRSPPPDGASPPPWRVASRSASAADGRWSRRRSSSTSACPSTAAPTASASLPMKIPTSSTDVSARGSQEAGSWRMAGTSPPGRAPTCGTASEAR